MTAAEQKTTVNAARRKRINRLKKIIIGTILAAILLPVMLCIVLSLQLIGLKDQLRIAEEECETLRNTISSTMAASKAKELLPEDETEEAEEALFKEPTQESRKVYLTFDDGPSENTEAILDILAAYDVKATFFVTGQQAERHPQWYQAIVDGGHTLGMHSYSHKYNEIYRSLDDFGSDLLKLQNYLEETTGVTPCFYRFPGGSSNTVSSLPMAEYCDYLTDNNITYFDWNISSQDAVNPMRPAEEIVENCVQNLENYNTAVILFHDSVNKASTVEALPQIIERILDMENTELLPITEDTVVIHHQT